MGGIIHYLTPYLQDAVLAADFQQQFSQQLDKAGSNVLLLQPAIVNLNIESVGDLQAGMNATFSASAGDMTLYMNLYDSTTSDLIGRYIDAESAPDFGFLMQQDTVTNKQAADRIMTTWADTLIKALDKAHGK